MKSIKSVASVAVILLAFAPPVLAGSFPGDDFNDNVLNTNKWGDSIVMDEFSTFLTETNTHLEFTGSVTSNSTVLRPWIAGMGSYTQNWEAAADVNLGAIAIPDNAGVQIFLAVANAGDPTMGDHLTIALNLDQNGSKTDRKYVMEAAVNGISLTAAPNYGEISTANTNGRMRIAFDASTKVLTASYNGNPLGFLDVDDASTSWDMADGSGFMIVLGASMWSDSPDGWATAGSEIYADNFIFRYGNNLSYDLAVNKGSGSGVYITGAAVAIAASNAPAGMTFDRWVGSIDYVLDAGSTNTTVTMPAQAITLTATYKLNGTSAGDDFDDNDKDMTKWGDDMVVNGTDAVLQETNGQLEFSKSSGDGSAVFRPWIYSVGSYTQSWEVSVDAHLSDIALPPMNGEFININLAVFNQQSTNLFRGMLPGDGIDIALDLYLDNGELHRGYELTSWAGGADLNSAPNYGYVATGDTQGRLKIAFDAATKVLTASYNGNVLGWVDVDAAGTDWAMTDYGSFGVAIAGGSGMISVPSGAVYADNFSVTSEVAPSADGNGNGLPDWWEQQYFGGLVSNPDGICSNGFNTIREAYIAGFDPNNRQSRFGITGGDPKAKTFQWNAVSGRVYNVYWTTNLLNGFQPLQTNYTGGSVTDSLHSAAGKCFYKIDVRLAQ